MNEQDSKRKEDEDKHAELKRMLAQMICIAGKESCAVCEIVRSALR